MQKRAQIALGMAVGAVWALGLVGLVQAANWPFLPPPIALPGAFLGPGLVIAALIARLAQRRFFDDQLIDGDAPPPGSPTDIDQRVLMNTLEQAALALLLWPLVAFVLGGAVVLALGGGFVLARLAFWLGYHLSPPLRAFGAAATFYPTLVAVFWAGLVWFL
ncbi:MAPEG family protein [Pontibaca salina]|uniref:MAPEG family protein n=1 Tax=Pontibaca salina TaxID=2795731 RepID=A0A934HS19_9RHOB|nr:MAPEG family protein [Pontibaca salina]MBI6629630.1 MAPEG family protein [Pontibaca salina]